MNNKCKICGNLSPFVKDGDTWCKAHQPEPTAMLKVLAVKKSLIDRLKQEASNEGMTLKEVVQLAFSEWLKQREDKL